MIDAGDIKDIVDKMRETYTQQLPDDVYAVVVVPKSFADRLLDRVVTGIWSRKAAKVIKMSEKLLRTGCVTRQELRRHINLNVRIAARAARRRKRMPDVKGSKCS